MKSLAELQAIREKTLNRINLRKEDEAEATRVKADAEADYNRTISASLSPFIIQEDWIEKWNGQLPQVTSGQGGMMINLPSLGK